MIIINIDEKIFEIFEMQRKSEIWISFFESILWQYHWLKLTNYYSF